MVDVPWCDKIRDTLTASLDYDQSKMEYLKLASSVINSIIFQEEVEVPNLPHPSKKFEEIASIPNQGLLHAFLAKCLRPNIAIFLFIFINFVLNTSDAGSDLALGFILKDRWIVTLFDAMH